MWARTQADGQRDRQPQPEGRWPPVRVAWLIHEKWGLGDGGLRPGLSKTGLRRRDEGQQGIQERLWGEVTKQAFTSLCWPATYSPGSWSYTFLVRPGMGVVTLNSKWGGVPVFSFPYDETEERKFHENL